MAGSSKMLNDRLNNQVNRGDCDVVKIRWSETQMRDKNPAHDEDEIDATNKQQPGSPLCDAGLPG
jgi:hypothetical protein